MDYSSQAHRTAHDQSNKPSGQLLALVGQHMQVMWYPLAARASEDVHVS